jgi:hypothetical protein
LQYFQQRGGVGGGDMLFDNLVDEFHDETKVPIEQIKNLKLEPP